MTTRRLEGRKVALALVGLVAMLAFDYSPVLRGEVLAGRDVFRIFFPDSAFLLESLRTGELPLWTPYMRLGQPFAATLYSQVFYPPRWVAVLVSGHIVSMTVMHIAHAALAAAGVFLLARRLRASWPAALVAGAMFGLSPMMTDLGIQQNVVDAAAWSGFILLAAYDLALQPGRGPLTRLAIFSTLSLFAGSPETTLWQGIIAVLVAGFVGATRSPGARGTGTAPSASHAASLGPSKHEGSVTPRSTEGRVAPSVASVSSQHAVASRETSAQAEGESAARLTLTGQRPTGASTAEGAAHDAEHPAAQHPLASPSSQIASEGDASVGHPATQRSLTSPSSQVASASDEDVSVGRPAAQGPLAGSASQVASAFESAPHVTSSSTSEPEQTLHVTTASPRSSRASRRGLRSRVLAVVAVAGGFILSAILASVVLVPTAEFALNSLRAQGGWSEQLAWSVSWPQVLSSVWPLADWPRDRYWGKDQWFILNLFLGTLPCTLAIVGGLHGPRRARPFLIGALALVLLSLGRHFPPAAWVLQSVPPFSLFRYPAKYFVGTAFCLSVLAAFGLDALGRLARKLPPSRVKAAVAFVLMGGAIAASGPVVRMLPMRASAEAGAPWVPFALGLAVVTVLLLPWSFARPRRVRHGLAALAVLELAAAHSLLGVPRYTPWEALKQPFSLRAFLPEPFQGRISADIEGPEDPTRVGITNTIERSLDRLIPNRFVEERLPALEGYGAPEPLRSDVFHLAGERGAYDLAGVTHYIRKGPPPFEDLELIHQAEDGTTLSRSRTALPRAFLVQRARVVSDEEALAAVLDEDHPFREIAFLATGEPLDQPECAGGSVRIEKSTAQHLELDVSACDDSYLVVSDSYYPGWRATVDGKDTPIHRANHALRAVRLTPGTHRVHFDYAPTSFRLGLALSLLGWAGLGFVWLRARRRA
ncbi:YfhO family protein [Myxococcus fulvus]|uniref:YfhO family protein n=1 Tax=Myxococcus fulvus TaxID=33 RepID=UPI0020C173EB|nr:YfhO family protein [Myxococcus fulvus]MCK8502734.1 YfhO family protein [Myxococcus fulvus]